MIEIEKLKNLKSQGEINYEDIVHDSVGFVVNNAIDKDNRDLYNATQGRWKCSIRKVKNADLVFSLYRGMIVGVWIPEKWYESDIKGRVYFEGRQCEDKDILDRYLYKTVPKAYSVVRYYGGLRVN
ncbi:hypothetical protein TPDSL_34580 [Terrisporobacter petrolearius]|uniref:hypothetical protein n=1 Tax=Terrisporobacter petrolearius TaxID=1460447 RepID=UPI0011DD9FD7